MPPRDWQTRIQDILDSIRAIEAYVRGTDFEAFEQDAKTLDAVVYRFAVIGEAARDVPEEVVAAHPEIPWREMRTMRNVMVHAYFGLKPEIIWSTIRKDLPGVAELLQKLLRQ